MSSPHSKGNHAEWPMTAEIQFLNSEDEWVHYSEISTVEHAKAWIAKRTEPERWRAVLKEVHSN